MFGGNLSMIIVIIIMILFSIIGVLFFFGKGASLIAGYNTMSEEEKAKYDETALTKFMGKMMFLYVFSMLLWVLSELFEFGILFTFGMILFIATTLYLVIRINTVRFRKEE